MWAIEGSGSYGAGLAAFLDQRGERVVEIGRRVRRNGPSRAKSDPLDAIEAAREALSQPRHAAPRAAGEREALRVLVNTREGAVLARTAAINQLRALDRRGPGAAARRASVASPSPSSSHAVHAFGPELEDTATRASALALRSTARRIATLSAEARQLNREIAQLVETTAPALLAEPGVGPISAARILIAWSHQGRFHSEAAFAMLAGTSPIPASSGQTVRHRLNRGGDRQLNRALHTIALSRRATHRADPRLHRPPHPRRQKHPRDQPLPQALPRPPPLPTARAISNDLTTIEASKQSASSAPSSPAGPTAPSTAPATNAPKPLTAGSGTTDENQVLDAGRLLCKSWCGCG